MCDVQAIGQTMLYLMSSAGQILDKLHFGPIVNQYANCKLSCDAGVPHGSK